MLRAGVIGLGVGERHISGYESSPHCKVVAICDLDINKLHQVAERHPDVVVTTSASEILENSEIDIISVASYDDVHCEQVISALENGKHVFVEKPICLTRSEFDDIKGALARSPHLRLSSNLILRRTPRFIDLRNRILAGDLGQLYFFEGDYDYGRLQKLTNGWRGQLKNYSVVHGGAIHMIDLMLWLTGQKVCEVFAYGNQFSTHGGRFANDDMVAALLKFRNGMVAKISANFGSVTPHHHRVSAYGTKGTFTQSHAGAGYHWSRDAGSRLELLEDPYPGAAKGDMLGSFVQSIIDSVSPEVTAREVFESMNVSLAISEALMTGEPVKVISMEDKPI